VPNSSYYGFSFGSVFERTVRRIHRWQSWYASGPFYNTSRCSGLSHDQDQKFRLLEEFCVSPFEESAASAKLRKASDSSALMATGATPARAHSAQNEERLCGRSGLNPPHLRV